MMNKILFLLLFIPSIGLGQRVIQDGTKLTKSDAVFLINEMYHNYFVYRNDFINTVTTSSPGNDVQATNSGTGAATSTLATSDAGKPGLVRSTTGTTITGRTAVATGASVVRLAGGAWVYEQSFNITTTSTVTERFQLAIGFIDTYTAANQVDGVYFLYDEGGVSTSSTATGNWQTVTVSNSTRTFNQNAQNPTAVAQGTWTTLRIEINAAGTSCVFKVNGTIIGTHTSTIPTGAGRECGFGWLLIKSIGTTARTVDVDYISSILSLTTAR